MDAPASFAGLNWQQMVAPYARADRRRSLLQILDTFIPYFVLWALMYWTIDISYWITLPLCILTAGFMVRGFIIFHDCCHGSFFTSRSGNEVLGSILGVFMFTPYHHWKHSHAIHHATAGNLDKRGVGDVMTLTVKEYLEAPPLKRLAYRIMRTPLFTFTIGATAVFLILNRFASPTDGKRERRSVLLTNLALIAYAAFGILIYGWVGFILIQMTIMVVATSIGVWMFYVQHQFDGVYWERSDKWSFVQAGLQGSSFYKLPRVLQWFTGNIGFHHIHHLGAKIPNYKLEQCYLENPAFQVKPLTLRSSLHCLRLNIWDEDQKRLVSFRDLKRPAERVTDQQ